MSVRRAPELEVPFLPGCVSSKEYLGEFDPFARDGVGEGVRVVSQKMKCEPEILHTGVESFKRRVDSFMDAFELSKNQNEPLFFPSEKFETLRKGWDGSRTYYQKGQNAQSTLAGVAKHLKDLFQAGVTTEMNGVAMRASDFSAFDTRKEPWDVNLGFREEFRATYNGARNNNYLLVEWEACLHVFDVRTVSNFNVAATCGLAKVYRVTKSEGRGPMGCLVQ